MLYKRNLYKEIELFIPDKEIIVIHGARQVGKTSLLKFIIENNKMVSDNYFYIDFEIPEYLSICNKGVSELIEFLRSKKLFNNGRLFLLIDEIQHLENPSGFLKLLCDHHSEQVKVITTGSSSFSIKSKFKDSLVGRIIDFELFPLSFDEYLEFKGINIDVNRKITVELLIKELSDHFQDFVRIGGYPGIVLEEDPFKQKKKLSQIISLYIKADIRDLGFVKDVFKFNKFLEILASQMGNLMNVSELSNSVGISKSTIENYLIILENTYIIKLVRPFYGNLRGELTKMPKIYFEDTGIAHFLKYKTLDILINGHSYENTVFTELRKNFGSNDLFYWRTTKNHEIDFILDVKRKIIPIEAKLKFSGKRQTSLAYFLDKYTIDKGYLCTLNKGAKNKYEWLNLIYPWDIYSGVLK